VNGLAALAFLSYFDFFLEREGKRKEK